MVTRQDLKGYNYVYDGDFCDTAAFKASSTASQSGSDSVPRPALPIVPDNRIHDTGRGDTSSGNTPVHALNGESSAEDTCCDNSCSCSTSNVDGKGCMTTNYSLPSTNDNTILMSLSYNPIVVSGGQSKTSAIPVGKCWNISIAPYCSNIELGTQITITKQTGDTHTYNYSGGVYNPPAGVFNTVSIVGSTIVETQPNGRVFIYDSTTGLLSNITDAYGNTWQYTYSGGKLSTGGQGSVLPSSSASVLAIYVFRR